MTSISMTSTSFIFVIFRQFAPKELFPFLKTITLDWKIQSETNLWRRLASPIGWSRRHSLQRTWRHCCLQLTFCQCVNELRRPRHVTTVKLWVKLMTSCRKFFYSYVRAWRKIIDIPRDVIFDRTGWFAFQMKRVSIVYSDVRVCCWHRRQIWIESRKKTYFI